MPEKIHSFCRICEALCGLEIDVENGKVLEIRPDKNHVATKGYSCVKGLRQHELYNSPDRLKYPQKKVNGKFEAISWKQAIEEIGAKVRSILAESHPDSIGMYVGTAAGFGVLHPIFAQGFMTGIGSKSMFSSATQDCSNKFATSRFMYGFPFTQPFPDVENTNCLIIVGANPAVSKWSFLQVSNPNKRIKSIKERGGKVFVIDPRKTETAKLATDHFFINPGTDVYFFLSFLNELIEQDGLDKNLIEKHTTGFERVMELAREWPAEKTQAITFIDPKVISELVRTFIESEGAALYSSTGVNMGGKGALSFWIQEVINAVSGNLDKKGGTLVGMGIMDFAKFGVKNGVLMREDKSRVGNFSSVNDAFPGGILADEILTPGEKQIKALFVTGGNPLITMPNSERLRKAFRELELLVCLDILPGETCAEANYVLPCTDPLQRPDLPFIFPLMLGLQSRPYLQATNAVSKIEEEQRDEATIYLDLAKASGINIFGSRLAQWFFDLSRGSFFSNFNKYKQVRQKFILNAILRLNMQYSFRKLLKYPNGQQGKEHKEESFLGNRVYTDDGKVHLAPSQLMDYRKQLRLDFEKEVSNSSKFKLITKRAVTTHNSWTHNHDRMVAHEDYTNYLYMHSKDAEALNLSEGKLVDVASVTSSVRLPVRFLDDLMQGVVALPHGWGHQNAKGLSIASRTKGVNVNILAADGPENLEFVSGMARLTGIEVTISPAKGEYAHTWSGIDKNEDY